MNSHFSKESKFDLERITNLMIEQNGKLESENNRLEIIIVKLEEQKRIFEAALKEKLKAEEKVDWIKYMLKK